MKDVWGTLSDIFLGNDKDKGVLYSSDFWGSMLPSLLVTAYGTYGQDDPRDSMPYTSTEEGWREQFDATQTLSREQMDLQRELAAKEIEAMKEAAAIKAKAAIKQAKIGAGASIYGTREKFLADALAQRIAGKRGYPEVIEKSGSNVVQSHIAKGAAGQQGFAQAADILSRFKR